MEPYFWLAMLWLGPFVVPALLIAGVALLIQASRHRHPRYARGLTGLLGLALLGSGLGIIARAIRLLNSKLGGLAS